MLSLGFLTSGTITGLLSYIQIEVQGDELKVHAESVLGSTLGQDFQA